jgi:cytochrome d ubiquinol oxidase subunit II
MEWYLPVIWAALIGVVVALYVILDGFDLGVGILFPAFRSDRQRDLMINSVAPFWDGNETWLVLGGGGLWVAFPQAYAVLMPAIYIPVILMLLALVFRGVPHGGAHQHGVVEPCVLARVHAGGFFSRHDPGHAHPGHQVSGGEYAGGPLDWATPFAVLCGLGVVAGYALLGATWLVMKTEGEVADRSRALAKTLILVVLPFMGVCQPLDTTSTWSQ